jgi:hypothetical protein
VSAAFVHLFNAENAWGKFERRFKEYARQSKDVGPYDAAIAAKLGLDAIDRSEAYVKNGVLFGLSNGPADAYRHCSLSCNLTKELGVEQASKVLNNHEEWNYDPNKAGSGASLMMDVNNNHVGQQFYLYSSCDASCLSTVQSYNPDSSRLFIIKR